MRDHDIQEIFKKLSLGKHAYSVYVCILKNSPILANHISQKTNLHRPTVYRTLDKLMKLDLIKKTLRNKQKIYSITELDKIREVYDKELKTIDSFVSASTSNRNTSSDDIRIIKNKNIVAEVFNDVLEHASKGETFYRYTSEKDLDYVNSLLPKDYRERRDRKKLERLVISNPISGNKKRPRLERFIKFIPQEVDVFDQNVIQLVYGDRVAMIDLNINEGVIIQSKALASFQKTIFKQLYNKLSD